MEKLDFLNPYFLGPYGENDAIFEKIITELFRDHIYWRRNFHPEDIPPISTMATYDTDYNQFIGRMRQELHKLTAQLKSSVPSYHPRYVGHMVSDMLMPGLIAQLVTTLYNPNNVNSETAPVTIKLELDVGLQLARMFGFNTENTKEPIAWGHLTSGGTTANYEGLLNFKAAKFYPLPLKAAVDAVGFKMSVLEGLPLPATKLDIASMTHWELLNLSIDEVLALEKHCLSEIDKQPDRALASRFRKCVADNRIESLGLVSFSNKYWSGELPVIMVPVTAHYSWEKAMKFLGFGSAQIIKIPIDDHMRMDSAMLDKALAEAFGKKQPVLAVIGVLGSTEFGTIDPIHEIVVLRDKWHSKGLHFSIHVDAAWGGYISTVFRDGNGEMIPRKAIRKEFTFFPSEELYSAFDALSEVDSITVDPHKMGFLPFGVGAFVARNRSITRLFSLKAPYVFDDGSGEGGDQASIECEVLGSDAERVREQRRSEEKLYSQFGQWIVEGSKPGSVAAAAYVSHAVLPLDHNNMGRIIAQTILSCEYFYEAFQKIKLDLKDKVHLVMPIEPDTNLVAIMFNPIGNRDAATMNRYSYRVYEHFKVDATRPVQDKHFLGTHTLLYRSNLGSPYAIKICRELNIDEQSFRLGDESGINMDEKASDHLFVLRHTTMNPWLRVETNGKNYIDKYFEYLKAVLLKELV